MAPFNGDGTGDFSQSLVRHKAVTSADSESISWNASAVNDAGTVIGMLNIVLQKHTHTTILWPSWILSGTTQVSQHQKGNTNVDLLEQEIVSGEGINLAICKYAP